MDGTDEGIFSWFTVNFLLSMLTLLRGLIHFIVFYMQIEYMAGHQIQ